MNDIQRQTHVLDATDQSVGRIATAIAHLLMGKNKPTYTPHIDAGDFVVIEHADNVRFTGRKLAQKDYYHHTLHPGGLKRVPMAKVFSEDAGDVIRRAVQKMLPKNSLRDAMMKRLTFKA